MKINMMALVVPMYDWISAHPRFVKAEPMRTSAIAKHLPVGLFLAGLCFFAGTVLDVGYYHFFGPGLWQPTIACDKPSQYLGKLVYAKKYPLTFVIQNKGSKPLVIQEVKPSCGGCVKVIDFPKEGILPSDSGVIRVALLTDKLKGAVEKTVLVRSNDPKTPLFVLRLRADVVRRSPRKVDVGLTSK